MESVTLAIILVLYATVMWRKEQLSHKVNKRQSNLLTLNQTVALSVVVTLDYFIFECCIWILPEENVLLFEMLKLILIDNLCYRFLVPLLLLLNTRKIFPELWTGTVQGTTGFYMTERVKIPRRPDTLTHTDTVDNQLNRKGIFIYIKSAD